jgi:hypothetical protein
LNLRVLSNGLFDVSMLQSHLSTTVVSNAASQAGVIFGCVFIGSPRPLAVRVRVDPFRVVGSSFKNKVLTLPAVLHLIGASARVNVTGCLKMV